jgi:hypothetical protein
MNVNDLPFPEAGGSCTFRLPDTLHYDDAPYIRYIPAGTELTLVTHDDGSRRRSPRQRMKTISVIDVLLLIVVAPWIAIMAVPVLPVITLLSVINLCRHLSVRAVWQHVDQPAKREAHAVGLILPVPAQPCRVR